MLRKIKAEIRKEFTATGSVADAREIALSIQAQTGERLSEDDWLDIGDYIDELLESTGWIPHKFEGYDGYIKRTDEYH